MERICTQCGRVIAQLERTITTYKGRCCEICSDKIDRLTPNDDCWERTEEDEI